MQPERHRAAAASTFRRGQLFNKAWEAGMNAESEIATTVGLSAQAEDLLMWHSIAIVVGEVRTDLG